MSFAGRCMPRRGNLAFFQSSRRLPLASCCRSSQSASSPAEESGVHRKSAVRDLIYPDPPTSNHNSLASFLEYAQRSGLDPKSTTFVGTHFEYVVAQSLTILGFTLRRIGGSSDNGIDLLGEWSVPSSDCPLRVLVQCKSVQRSGPHLIRELEGAFVGAPPGWRGSQVLGLLATEKPATKGIREALGRSRWPMGFVSCSREGYIQQLLWNHRADEEGLEGLGVGLRYSPENGEKQLSLMWRGEHLPKTGKKL